MSQRTISVVIGKPGAGKTYRLKKTMLPAMPHPMFILDLQGEFDQGIIYTGENHHVRHPVRQMLDLMETEKPGIVRGYNTHIIRPHPATDFDTGLQQLADLLKIADSAKWPGTFVVDEADLYSTAGSAISPIKNMVFRGRHAHQHLIFTAKRTTTISKNILDAAHGIVCFRQTQKEDLNRLNRSFSAENRPAELGQYEYVVLGDDPKRLPFYDALIQQPEYQS